MLRIDFAAVVIFGGAFCFLGAGDFTPPGPSVNVPCRIVDWQDGDTATVEVRIETRVRMLDCWAPEIRGDDKERGFAAKAFVESEFPAGTPMTLEVPIQGDRLDHHFSFGRVLGNLRPSGGGKTAAERMVEAGHATKTKGEK